MTKAKKIKTEEKNTKPETVADILKRKKREAKEAERKAEKKRQEEEKRAEKKRLAEWKKQEKERIKREKLTFTNLNQNGGTKGNFTSYPGQERTLKKEAEYLAFIEFLATPEIYREDAGLPADQQEFAKKFKVSETTLSTWKNRSDFDSRYNTVLKKVIQGKLIGKTIAAVMKKVLKEGNAAEAKIILQLGGVLEDKSTIEVAPKTNLTPEQTMAFANRLALWKKVNLGKQEEEEEVEDKKI